MVEPVPILTFGDLKSELSRWSDETPVTFRSPLNEQEFRDAPGQVPNEDIVKGYMLKKDQFSEVSHA
jgi:hypothetical protein